MVFDNYHLFLATIKSKGWFVIFTFYNEYDLLELFDSEPISV